MIRGAMSQAHVEALTEHETYDLLCAYTVTHADPDFVHQHVVDTLAAQTATASTKPIALAMSLVGLYLAAEKGYSGRKVQHVHAAGPGWPQDLAGVRAPGTSRCHPGWRCHGCAPRS